MPTYTLLPTAVNGKSGTWPPTGTATDWYALADGSDTTSVKKTSTSSKDWFTLKMADPSIPANERIKQVRFSLKMQRPSAANCEACLAVTDPTDWSIAEFARTTYLNSTSGIVWRDGPWQTNPPSVASGSSSYGKTWDDVINYLLLVIHDKDTAGTTATTFYEARATVETLTQPVVAVSLPTGTVENATSPQVAWTFTQAQGEAQDTAVVRIFDSSAYSAADFDPDTTPASAEFTVNGTDTLVNVGPLPTGGDFRAYVKAGIVLTPYQPTFWSAWAYSPFVMSVTPPPLSITAAADDTHQSIDLTVAARVNLLAADTASAEVTVGGWAATVNAGTPAVSSTHAATGTKSVRWTATGAGDTAIRTATDLAAIAPGVTYRAVCSFRSGGSARTAHLDVEWLDAAGSPVSTSTSSNITASTSAYTEATVDAVAPEGAAYARLRAYVASAGSGEAHHVDKAGIWPTAAGVWTPGGYTNALLTITRTVGGDYEAGEGYVLRAATSGGDGDTAGDTDGTVVRDGAIRYFQVPVDLTHQLVYLTDHLAPRGTAVTYTASLSLSDGAIQTAVGSTPTAIVSDGTCWLKACLDPTLNLGSVNVRAGSVKYSTEEQIGVFRPLGRTTPVVVSGALYGEDGGMTILTQTPQEWAAVRALARHQGPLLFQDPMGEHHFIRVTARPRDLDGTPTAPLRSIDLSFVDVGEP